MPLAALLALPAEVAGVGSRAQALGGAYVGQADDFSATFYNPAGLTRLPSLQVALAPLVVVPDHHMGERAGDEPLAAGYYLGLAGPLGRLFRLPELAAGLTVYLPFAHLFDVQIPEREDARTFLFYGDRLQRLSINPALALRPIPALSFGIGVDVFLDLDTDTAAVYSGEPHRPEVELSLTRGLDLDPSLYAGVMYLADTWSAGFCWRQQQAAETKGPNTFALSDGVPLFQLDLDYVSFFTPSRFALGLSSRPFPGWRLNADAVYARWSEYRTFHGKTPSPPLEDVVSLRLGAGYAVLPWLELLAGYAHEPSPVPDQRAVDNLLDAGRQSASAGLSVELGRLTLSAHGQVQVMADRRVVKAEALQPDADTAAAGRQIDTVGYPSYGIGGQAWVAGLTVTYGGR